MRVFLGIDLPEDVKTLIHETVKPYLSKLNCKPVEKENLHVTIKFYGEIAPSRLDELVNLIRDALTTFEKFEMLIKGSGVFPEIGTPRVLWIGLDSLSSSILKRMFAEIEARSRKAGFRAETKEYHPHITVARLKSPVNLRVVQRFIKELSSKTFATVSVERVVLFKSTLTFDGPIYEKLVEFEL